MNLLGGRKFLAFAVSDDEPEDRRDDRAVDGHG